jgi:hypothetical protein
MGLIAMSGSESSIGAVEFAYYAAGTVITGLLFMAMSQLVTRVNAIAFYLEAAHARDAISVVPKVFGAPKN